MKDVRQQLHIAGADPDEVFARVADFEAYPTHSTDIESVRCRSDVRGWLSDWEVHFQQGLLSWTEQDEVEVSSRTLRFSLVEGDFDVFEGGWAVTGQCDGALVDFHARFDFGVATLEAVIEPVAARLITRTIEEVLLGMFGRPVAIGSSGAPHA